MSIIHHPVQVQRQVRVRAAIPEAVALAAYEVYCELHGPQPAMVDVVHGNCRGGFSAGEHIAFLYARSFPREEWRQRVKEAREGMEGL